MYNLSMKKLSFILISLFISITLLTPVFADTPPLTGKVIVIDAGHGGKDPGTTMCPDLTEADANLEIAVRLKELLESPEIGAEVVMTRTDNSYMTNEDRYTIANGAGGDALVSIHLNGSVDTSENGTLGLYAKIKKDKAFTGTLQSALDKSLNVGDMGVTNFMSGVTLRSEMPATIQEAVYLSNATECALFKDGTGDRQQQIADALLEGLINWFDAPTSWAPPGQLKKVK